MYLICVLYFCFWFVFRFTFLICVFDVDYVFDSCCVCFVVKEMLSRDQDCLLSVEEVGVFWDSVCFLFLLLQCCVFFSYYFLYVRVEFQVIVLLVFRLVLFQVFQGFLGQASFFYDIDTFFGGRIEVYRFVGFFYKFECLIDDERFRFGFVVSLLFLCRLECVFRLEGFFFVVGRLGLLFRRRFFISIFFIYEIGGYFFFLLVYDKAGVVVGSWFLV